MTHSGSLECLNIAIQGYHLETERRIVLIAKELAWYHTNYAAWSETRLIDEGMPREAGAGYPLFDEENLQMKRLHGVGLAIRTSLIKDTPYLPVRINEHLM